MADSVISMEKVKAFWHSQVHDEEKWALNMLAKVKYLSNVRGDVVIMELGTHLQPKRIFGTLEDSTIIVNLQKLLRAGGLFAGSILLMRNFGDLMTI